MSVLKPFNKHRTRQTVAPIHAETSLTPDEVRWVVEQLVAADRDATVQKYAAKAAAKPRSFAADAVDRHLHARSNEEGFHLSFPYDYKSRNDWDAEIVIVGDETGSSVTCQILQWLAKDGEINFGIVYLRFVDDLGVALARGAG